MAFVPTGKKALRKREAAKAHGAEREAVIEEAVVLSRVLMSDPGLCLPMCVFMERLLQKVLRGSTFTLRLGSLRTYPGDASIAPEPLFFDPRGPDGIDGGFHAWLEDADGALLDPSVFATLADRGFNVNPRHFCRTYARKFWTSNVAFEYEELPELELIGLPETASVLQNWLAWALRRKPDEPFDMGHVHLDVRWRRGVTRGAPSRSPPG
jgi:hypothetical protein